MTHYDNDIIAYNSVIIVTRFADDDVEYDIVRPTYDVVRAPYDIVRRRTISYLARIQMFNHDFFLMKLETHTHWQK